MLYVVRSVDGAEGGGLCGNWRFFNYLYFSNTCADGTEWYRERQQSSDVYKDVHERERSRSRCRYAASPTKGARQIKYAAPPYFPSHPFFIVLCTIKNGFATAIKAHRQIRYDKGENDELCNELGRSLGDQPCLYT